jgi:hypothetical protein
LAHSVTIPTSIATRYDRCAHTFFGACALAAVILFWL